MNRQQAQSLITAILAIPHPGELQVEIRGVSRQGTRFNDCAISQNTLKNQATLTLTARLGQKQTAVTINSLDDFARIENSIDRVFAICAQMPDDAEVMPALGQVIETNEHAFDSSSEKLEIEIIGAWAAEACKLGASATVDLAGLLSFASSYQAYGDSRGGFAFERHHRSDFHVTASADKGSGWAEHQGVRITLDDVVTATRRAIEKCVCAQDPRVFDPKPTTVILEPQAVGDLLAMAFWYGFDQRALDEGRSAFSDFDGTLGKLSFYSDPADPQFPTIAFTNSGEALNKSVWLDRGKLQQLATSRYWAQAQNLTPKPVPHNLILSGDGTSLEQLIATTDDGILVTRFWYIRSTDAKTLSFTGMTRDGTYRIKNGQVAHPVVDMRWNESALQVLKQVVASGVPVATGDFFSLVVPPLKVDNFHFSSLSD